MTPRRGPCCGRSKTPQSAGDSVSALIADRNIETATVTANCRNSSPEMPGMNATGTNTDSSTSVIAMIGAVISRHRPFGGARRRKLGMLFHHPLDILDDHDGIVDDDADGEHDSEKGDRIGRIADGHEHDEGADQADRHRKHRDQGRAHASEEQKDDDDDEDECLDQRLLHFVDGIGDEGRRIVGDLPGEIVGESLFQLGQCDRAQPSAWRWHWRPAIDRWQSAAAGPPLSRVSRSRLAAPSSSLATSPRRSTEPSGLARMTILANSAGEFRRPLV